MSATDHHPGDEALSASLDGEATPAELTHIASCSACQERVARLAAAARAIAEAPVTIDPARRDMAIAAALAARVVPIASRRFRPPVWAVGAAAAALLAAVLVPSLANRHADNDRATTAAPDQSSPAPEAGAKMSAPTPAVDAGDLGPLDADGLRPRVLAALQPSSAASGSGQASGKADAAAATAAPVCDRALAGADPSLGSLRLVGRGTVAGRAAEVLAYAGTAGDQLRVFVVALDDCADILLRTRFELPR